MRRGPAPWSPEFPMVSVQRLIAHQDWKCCRKCRLHRETAPWPDLVRHTPQGAITYADAFQLGRFRNCPLAPSWFPERTPPLSSPGSCEQHEALPCDTSPHAVCSAALVSCSRRTHFRHRTVATVSGVLQHVQSFECHPVWLASRGKPQVRYLWSPAQCLICMISSRGSRESDPSTSCHSVLWWLG
ncbi:hypothetical protein BT67DRAFT_79337 [Trichocladium antarcticum]|uniref:Uncharacterized protein n=1 Tax=Trichocladium antarcticum TaxID=1450529 RepID=A0AAN6ZC80_9PEZI|nr:hypothetical protein BT67DRAFT_79337 [Trichocladium antarcticum]